MVFCTYCGQSFTRDEHLERHILTHTNVKPFKCFTCHMSFARRDLLQRHYTVHGKDQNQEPIPAANGMIPKSAGRTPIACSNCAKTKTKCDKKFPCSRCAGRNLRCTLRPTRRSSKNAARMGVPPEGAVAIPPYTEQLDPQAALNHQASNGSSPQQHLLKPASPKGAMAMMVEEKQAPLPMRSAVDGPPPQTFEQSTSGPAPGPHHTSPNLQTPGGFVQRTPGASFDNHDESETSSPRFMLDWSQMQMPMGFDGMVQPSMLMHPDMPFDPNAMPLVSPSDAMLPVIPELAHGVPPLITPIETPKVEQAFSDLELGSSAAAFRPQRQMSQTSTPEAHSDIAPIIAAQDAWSVFRCTPTVPSTSCPKTARLNLELLEQTLRNHEGWSTWSPQWDEADFAGGDHLTVMQLHESTRDKLLAITQSFLHKALEIHRDHNSSLITPPSSHHSPSSHSGSNFVLLPPARVLEYFLRSYSNCFERYYPLTSRGILDVNELLHCYNDRAASLLVLMMIAQGANNIPSKEARLLTGGLTEACRISLFDLIERNVIMSGDPIVLHAALLFTVQAAWSGDKWHMDIAMGQRGMYFAMLRHSGVLEIRQTAPSAPEHRMNTDQMWSEWIQNESRSRLIYSWVMVDQDMSLFHDTAPLFSVTEFGAPMPDTDRLWHSRSAAEWSSTFEQVHEFSGGYSSVGSGARPLSLRDLFRHFLDDEMVHMGIEMTPLQMRLLLHPLQSLVCQYSQLLSCFSDTTIKGSASPRAMTAASTRTRLEEVQSLLRRWYDLAERYLKANPMCGMMQTNLVIFHLISLNAATNFPEIERLARRENVDGTYQQLAWLHKKCIADVEEAVFHTGQIFRHVRAMPRGMRPPWWAAAIYRAGMILWANSLVHKETFGPVWSSDRVQCDHPLLVRYLTKREGVATLTRGDGTALAIDQPFQILQHCVDVIEEGGATQFSDGLKTKMMRLAKG